MVVERTVTLDRKEIEKVLTEFMEKKGFKVIDVNFNLKIVSNNLFTVNCAKIKVIDEFEEHCKFVAAAHEGLE